MADQDSIPVIDLFAGPGGLGEGFSAFSRKGAARPFRIALSIEMEECAHRTLELRSFFRSFPSRRAPSQYYAHLRGELTRDELFARFPEAAEVAKNEAWRAELGVVESAAVDRRIRLALGSAGQWILCGGPPCQAFSVVGRSRNGGIAEDDHRVYLYKQYLRILSVHEPSLFILENVKGLLSSAVSGSDIFDQMLEDLRHPGRIIKTSKRPGAKYSLHSLVLRPPAYHLDGHPHCSPGDFVIKCENYGIPQSRQRVIILGVREDLARQKIPLLKPHARTISASKVLKGLPRLRSGLTRSEDGKAQWRAAVASILEAGFLHARRNGEEGELREYLIRTVLNMRDMQADRGGEFVSCTPDIDYEPGWFLDPAMGGVTNHSSRPHMAADLHRYIFAACYAKVHGRSPELNDFPAELHPDHKNLKDALSKGYFDDRFRVQMSNRPATTITSHIAKDGHYFIHFDETQCRSLTVREAARLQTFPDNYYFCGPRTQQYRQVGNAVPPLLALQIAGLAATLLKGWDGESPDLPITSLQRQPVGSHE
jgi:DNA (cytosine-5)-methyltransferase 1